MSILEDFSCQVYLLGLAPRLIPQEDEDISVALADACVNAARRIMTEFLAHRAGVPQGRA